MLPESAPDPKPTLQPIPMPDNWPGITAGLNQAIALLEENQLDDAGHALDELGNFATADARLWYLRGKLERKRGNAELAKEHYRRAKRLQQRDNAVSQPDTPGSIRIAKLMYNQGDREKALTMINELLTSRPRDLRLLRLKNRWQSELQPEQDPT